MKERNPKIEFDRLQVYFAEPYTIDVEGAKGTLTIYQPSIGDVAKMGETKFYSSINIFTCNTTSYRLPLWDVGIDWCNISDFDLFVMLYKGVDDDVSRLIFKDVLMSEFQAFKKKTGETEEVVLYNKEKDIEITEQVYFHLSQYLRTALNIFPEEKITSDPFLKRGYINKDRRQKEIDAEKQKMGKQKSNSIVSLISACVNHPGFKYNIEQLKNISVAQFYDSVQRLQVYESARACMGGLYSGMVDSKKIQPDNYNFMKEI